MHRTHRLIAWAGACLLLAGCAATAEERVGQAEGYGGTLKVLVTLDGEKLTSVQVTEHHETQGVGTRAIDALPEKMAAAGTWQVEAVSGATVTSGALMAAVQDAMGESLAPSPESLIPGPATVTDVEEATPVRSGLGMAATGRIGPGQDDTGGQVYSFNVVFAHGEFDAQGKILTLDVDQLEVATPNYDGAGMPHFSGFPGQGGYALWDDAQGKTAGKTEDSDETFLAEVSSWVSKRGRGDDYKLASGTWRGQMDAYERLFTGMTVDEVEAWFGKYCSPVTGRPLKEGSDNADEQAQYDALSDEEKKALADVTSSATMSLRDGHGDILTAIRRAWENAQ